MDGLELLRAGIIYININLIKVLFVIYIYLSPFVVDASYNKISLPWRHNLKINFILNMVQFVKFDDP